MGKPADKIVLLNPVTRNKARVLRVERCQQKVLPGVGVWPPVTLLEIAAYLNYKGFLNLEILDAEAERVPFEALSDTVAEKVPALVVMQATTPTIEDDIECAARIKKALPETVVVFIGLHATVFPAELLRHEPIDYVIIGEPEVVVTALADYCLNRKGDRKEIKGLAYKDNSRICVNKAAEKRETYDYPLMPDRSLLKNDLYVLALTGSPFTVIKVSRGCDFQCPFCTSGAYYGRGWRARSPENIVAEIIDAKERFGLDTFMFLSDTFNNKSEFVDGLSSLIIEKKLNIRWVSNSRVDLVNESSARLMKKAGCMLVSLGIESFDEGVLRKNKKYMDRAAIKRAIEIFKNNGILTYGYFILGLEGETRASMVKTIFLARGSKLDYAIFYSLTPYPGTEYFNRHKISRWSDYFHGISDIVEYKGLSKKTIKLYKKLALFLFYGSPLRMFSLIRFLLRGKVC
jgi:radical SAM superfamily enzyme YgiQ (UPF0313 family)